ncbi:MAG: methyltransferase [Stygiobacter sp. RIFOXYC12_FULL_38_8]|nr:MAG: methyltransferase [Stygiobacter sp. RIFOXYB2_FULL_37_11]OGV12166.1 MAG: methyltransferase [Stygiobacter sp. RIFOXYC2_FULL_38_25]OGV12212.1 MAG: methyltransferase [Stygiobacter sp. RIFOXYA2_FULL_38_8]OGV30453.1 MAG: methyltransferase [Stygiobacter sp. RIFOXYC12_FULL_38_8]OGV81292.1 MAG: methyltransferase [Stygiobacter sp. GWF2_38_21]RJQ57959.1 MAG: O-methyltransferase [Stygiobacter sp.]
MKGIVFANQEKYLTTLRNKPDALIAEMEEFALENQVPILNWNAAELLEMLVRNSKPKRVLEIGMAIGYSSIRIARQLKKKSILHAIEKSKVNIELAAAYIDRAELTDKIQIMEGDALAIMPEMKKKYDFIFLDADKQDYEKLFHYSLKLLKKNGIIFIDNLLWHGFAAARNVPAKQKKSTQIIREFNKLFLNTPSLQSTIIPVGDGVGIGIKVRK